MRRSTSSKLSERQALAMKMPENIDKDLQKLWTSLIELHHFCREHTRKNYKRVNPFMEDIFDWAEKGSYCMQEDKGITIYDSATLIGDVKIGEHTWIGPFCMLDGGGGLEIGKFCSISTGCQLLSHDTINWALSGGKMAYEYAATKIGDCCFLGVNAVVTKGVAVGNHCLVGAGAVVTQDVADNTIVGGVPAEPIGKVEVNDEGKVRLIY
jgi:acetyltransferase-like isoleucine patch superfamily enzyme